MTDLSVYPLEDSDFVYIFANQTNEVYLPLSTDQDISMAQISSIQEAISNRHNKSE